MTGTAVAQALSSHDLYRPKRSELDVSDWLSVKKFQVSIDLIIHLAAETEHDICHDRWDHAYMTNTVGTAYMVDIARNQGIPLYYIGAGSIFDGMKPSPYDVTDTPNPINHYNKSKYYGECIVKDYVRGVVIRPGWMFGGGEFLDKKFVNKIITKIKLGQKTIKVCDDCIGSPIYTGHLAEAIKRYFIEDDPQGNVFHIVNDSDGGVSRYEYGLEVVNCLGLQNEVDIEPCSIDDLKEEFPTPRTNYEVLKSSFLLPHWKTALKEYIIYDGFYN